MKRSIRRRITICIMATVLASLLLVGASSIVVSYRSTIDTVDQMMSEAANLASERIEQELIAYKNIAMDTGCLPQLSDPAVSAETKQAIINERAAMHGLRRGNVIGSDGISVLDGKDYSDREYVRQAMQGRVYVSEPLISKITGELSIMVAAPLYANGDSASQIVGVVYFVPTETFLNDIVASIKVGESCQAYMINKAGDTIADVTLETITTQNIEKEAAADSSLKQRAEIHSAMRQGQIGFGSYVAEDGRRLVSYAPVNGTDGWSVAVTVLKSEYMASTYFGIIITMIVILIAVLVSVVVAMKLSGNISGPMRACAERMKQLVAGDLSSPLPEVAGQDETAELTRSTAELVSGLNIIISDVGYLLNEMANLNFDVRSSHRDAYVGKFQDIIDSMRNLKLKMNETMKQIDVSAGQVSAASGQVSVGAQNLSQGSMEQASAVEQLAATITDISQNAKMTAAAAEEAGKLVERAGAQLGTSVTFVNELNVAMNKISDSSEEISKIIATIENIAFQTNILALNAAVEAARAGAAGKGFAVVADEVRNLATKSDEAAKATKQLIEDSIHAVEEGGHAVAKVTESLERTNQIAGNVTGQMDTVVNAVDNQTASIQQVTEGIDQISAVVQTNSATAQESAAASEELSAEANSLKQMVDRFTFATDV